MWSEIAAKTWNTVKSWAVQNAEQYLYVPIPQSRADTEYEDEPLEPDTHYFRLWLSEMFLTQRRAWFVDWYPAVHTAVLLKYGNDQVSLNHLARAPGEGQARGVFMDYPVTELLPFRGGIVEIESSLVALQGKNYIAIAVRLVESFAKMLVSAPLSQMLAVAQNVTSSINDLLDASKGEIHLGMHKAFSGEGPGARALRPGYFAVILATDQQVAKDRLSVSEGRLYYRRQPQARPELFQEADYVLYYLESARRRKDWRSLQAIDAARRDARSALLRKDQRNAEAFTQVALIAAYNSPDLVEEDRIRVAKAIEAELADVAARGPGAVGAGETDLDDVQASFAMTPQQAASLRGRTFDQLFPAN